MMPFWYRRNRRNLFDMELTPLIAIIVAVVTILLSIPFWIEFSFVAQIQTKEDAKYVDATILSYRESVRSKPNRVSMQIYCSDSNMYEIRQELYTRYKALVKATISDGARASIYAGPMLNDVLELKIYGRTVIPFEEGYKHLSEHRIVTAVFAALLDITGIIFIILIIVKIKREREWRTKA